MQYFWSAFYLGLLGGLTEAARTVNVHLTPGHDPYMLLSPNHPRPSDKHDDVIWSFQTEEPAKIGIHCTDFRFVETNPCRVSYIAINPGEPDEVTLCGSHFDYERVSMTSRMVIQYSAGEWGGGALKCLVQATTSGKAYHFYGADPSEVESGEGGLINRPGKKATTCKCGWVNKNPSRIYGGREVQPNEYPWLVALITGDKLKMPQCGGSIITKYHVLTAAHCVTEKFTGKVLERLYSVLVGEHDWQAEDNAARQIIRVKDIIKFDNYTSYVKHFDIAILNLEKAIEFSDRVGPVCLSKPDRYMGDEWVKVMGWGRVNDEGYFSTVAKVTNTRILNIHACSAKYSFLMNTENSFHVCTWAKDTDACRGDSGGPLVWLDPETNRYTEVALVSHSMSCAESIPSVNTNVTFFFDWIRTEVINSNPDAEICY